MASKYDKNKLINNLKLKEELNPDEHDGSYELVRETIRAYANMKNSYEWDYKDINLVYLMTIGTWRHSIGRKKQTINDSHLSDSEKQRLVALLDRVWEKAKNNDYSNGSGSVGMFGTGFYSFMGKTTNACVQDFIQMCIDIDSMNDPEQIYDRTEKVLKSNFRGMKAASASMILHCFKPSVFPVLNSNMGMPNIFEAMGVKLKKKGEIATYVSNCREIYSFREKQFQFTNYRIFDMFAWSMEEYLMEEKTDSLINIEVLREQIKVYKANFEKNKENETYKWEAVKNFQDHFDIDVKDFPAMLENALAKEENLLTRMNFFAKTAILDIARYNPEYTREMFRNLYDEDTPVPERIEQFESDADIYYDIHPNRKLMTYQDAKASTVYLFLHNPEKYSPYMSMKFQYAAKLLGYTNIPPAGTLQRIEAYYDLKEQVWNYIITDQELLDLNQTRMNEQCYSDPNHKLLAEDIMFFLNWRYRELYLSEESVAYKGYWPEFEEYNPNLSAEEYEQYLTDETIIRRDWLDVIYRLYQMGGEGTCKQIATNYGKTASHYLANANVIAKNLLEVTGLEPCARKMGTVANWPILFVGKDNNGQDGIFLWKLRNPLREAIKSMEAKGIFQNMADMVDYPKNMILYGPPGTGKTYNTVLYAVAIIEGKMVEEIRAEKYADVKTRFDKYMQKKQIGFTTFHQSYGYEEFIEGIKPVMDRDNSDGEAGEDVKYVIKPGVFKEFCENAETTVLTEEVSRDYGFNSNPTVWKVSLSSTYDNPIRTECMEHSHIRIGWDEYGPHISDSTDFSQFGGKNVLNAFINKMQIGDIVLSCYTAQTIDAIGVVTGDYEWVDSFENYKRVRSVKWLVKGLNYNIIDINGGSAMTLPTVYKLSVSVQDVIRILEQYVGGGKVAEKAEKERFVFIVDEINRGNISKIFGELITVLEESKRVGEKEGMRIKLPYSPNPFGIPNNIYFIGTMNTADRSIAMMDTALRRRFCFKEMMPEADLLNDIELEDIRFDEMLRMINKRIEALYDREHTIGHSYFMSLKDNPTMEALKDIFQNRIIPLLQEYFFDDYEKIRLVLGDNQKADLQHQFIVKEEQNLQQLFGVSYLDEVDFDDKVSYRIQQEAFDIAESYIGIYEA